MNFEQINPYGPHNEFMAERFYLSQPVSDGTVTLADDQAHHVARVMRAKPGDQIVLFDGHGNEYQATIADVSKKNVSLTIDSSQSFDCLLYTSPSPRDQRGSRMPSSA